MSSIAQPDSSTARRGLNLRTLTLILLIVGLIISGYLSYTHLTETSVICVESGTFDCDAVNSSLYSKLLGIPVAYLGFGADVFLLVILLLEKRVALLRDYGVMVFFGVVLLGWLYHDYLTFVSIQYIQKFCIWCLAHHAIMTLLLIVTGIRLYRVLFPGENAA